MIPNYENFKLGNAQVDKIYLGDDLIWQAAASEWGDSIFRNLTFTGGYLSETGQVVHQTIENYGTSNYFECGSSSLVRVKFTPRYGQGRIVAVCAYDENYAFVGSAIYEIVEHPDTSAEAEFIGEIPQGAVYLRYAYLWGYNPYYVPGDVNTSVQLSRR